MLLYLVRHGHTQWSDSGKIAGVTDVSLSDNGQQAVSMLAKSMPEPAPDLYYSSDLVRAVQTLELLVSPNHSTQDPRLRELNFGQWEGLTWDEVHQRDARYLKRWSDNWMELAPPAGESFNELAKRTNDWFHDLLATTKQPSSVSSIMVAAHGGSIRALICNILDIPLHSAFKFSIGHSRVTVLHISNDGHHQCRFLNGTSLQG